MYIYIYVYIYTYAGTPIVSICGAESACQDEPVSSWWGICRLAACITNIGMIVSRLDSTHDDPRSKP